MAKKRQSKNGDYDIGRNKTPPWTRFQPGQSGNPNGRPKKSSKETPMTPTESELDNLLRAELDRELTINEGGKPKKMKARELVPRSQINSAIKGNSNAQRHVMLEMRELERRDAERARLLKAQQEAEREQPIKVYEYMVRKKDERAAIWKEAATRGCEPDQPWLHPEDILLFPKQHRWRIRGPFDETDLTYFNWCRAERDYLYAYGILEGLVRKPRQYELYRLYMILWVSYDAKLPRRWQIADQQAVPFFNLSSLTETQLEQIVDERREHAAFLKALSGISDERDRETYIIVNSIMKPLLQRRGYRSLAEFKHACETPRVDMACPKEEHAIRSR